MKRLLLLIIALCGITAAQVPYSFMPYPRVQFLDSNGSPLAGGFLYFFNAGTSVPAATYHLDTLGNLTVNTAPVILDSTGSAEVRLLPQEYKVVLQDANHNQIWSVDQVADVGQLLYSQVVLLNPPGAALQTIAGPLAATSLALGGAAPLTTTAQSGTGILCMTVNCALTTPSINAITIPNSPGTYISLANSSTTGTTVNTLTKFASAVPAWVKRNDQTITGSGSPETVTFSTPLTNPSLIVVLASGPTGTYTITDTAGNSYLDCGQGQIVFNSSADGTQCFYSLNTHTTTSNVVSFASTGGGTMSLVATEWTGSALVSPVDVLQNSGTNVNTGSGGGQNLSSGGATTTGADLVIGMAGVVTGPLTVGTGFTPTSSNNFEYLTQSGPGALAATWSDPTNTDPYAALMVAFKPYPGINSTAVIVATTDTTGVQGITVSGAGTTGNAIIQQSGTVPCQFDGPTNATDYVQISTITGGDCHDTGSGATAPASGQVVGRVLTSNTVAGIYAIDLFPQTLSSNMSGSVKTICSTGNQITVNANVATLQPVGSCQFPNGSLNAVGKSFRVNFYMTVSLSGSMTSTVYVYASPTASPIINTSSGVANQIAASTTWHLSDTSICIVTASGTSGTLNCTHSPIFGAIGTPVPLLTFQPIIASVNLTGPVYVGSACLFAAGSISNSCYESAFTVEQLN